MGRELGRISGPLLADNLKRNGANLAFDNKVLFLDVNNNFIGVNTNAPTNDLTVNTTVTTTDLIVDTNTAIANIEFTTNVIQNVVSSITISPNQASSPTVLVPQLATANLKFATDTVSNTVTNSNINVTATGTGSILLNSNTTVTGNLHATGVITFDGNIAIGDDPSDTVTFTSTVNSNILPSITNTDDLGSSSLKWANLYTTNLKASVVAPTLTITTFSPTGANVFNGAVTLGTNSTNTLSVLASFNSDIVPNTNNIYNLGSTSKGWNYLYATTLTTGNIQATGNTVSTVVTDTNLQISADGSGAVSVEYLNVVGSTISNAWPSPTTDTQRSIIFTPNGTGNTRVDTTTSLILPIRDNSVSTLTVNGELRFNGVNLGIEGYSSSGYVNLMGLYSQNRNTYITAESAPGAGNNEINFYVNNVLKATVSSTKLITNTLVAGNIQVNGTEIINTDVAQPLTLSGNGSGFANLNGVRVRNNSISTPANSVLPIVSLGLGYVKFAGSNALALPVGTNSNKPATPEQGATRYNTELTYHEIYDTTLGWIPLSGVTVTAEQIIDTSQLWSLILGY
jgi:hypothetical protein